MSNASASITVKFGDGSTSAGSINGHLSAEIDNRPTGLNAGKTSFSPGETCWFLVYKTSNVSIKEVVSSAGTVSTGGTVSVNKEVEVSFIDTNASSLPVPATAIVSTVWMGRDLGAITVGAKGTDITAASSGVAVAQVTYQASALTYGITAPTNLNGVTEFSILVVIMGEPAAT